MHAQKKTPNSRWCRLQTHACEKERITSAFFSISFKAATSFSNADRSVLIWSLKLFSTWPLDTQSRSHVGQNVKYIIKQINIIMIIIFVSFIFIIQIYLLLLTGPGKYFSQPALQLLLFASFFVIMTMLSPHGPLLKLGFSKEAFFFL